MTFDPDNPRFLYRYRPLKYIRGRKVLHDEIELIRNGFIWLSKPKDLNDPFDCRPIIRPEQRERLESLLEHFLVGSLSALPPDSTEASPMWSHYADNHRGLCIEFPFDTENAKRLIPIEKVRYSDDRFDIRKLHPEKMRITSPRRLGVLVDRVEFDDPENNFDILELTRKSKAWEKEAEWRFIWRRNHGSNAGNEALISRPSRIIFGAQMSVRVKNKLKRVFSEMGIPTVEAVCSESVYKVDFGGVKN